MQVVLAGLISNQGGQARFFHPLPTRPAARRGRGRRPAAVSHGEARPGRRCHTALIYSDKR